MHKPPDTMKSLQSLLVENHEAGRPLLDGAVLYRGTRLPDQTQGIFSQDEMHGSLLLQVAATYTHNWTTTDTGFIGEYPVTRDTRFYADFGLEQAQNGEAVKSHGVQDVEAALAPLVAKLAAAKSPRDAMVASEAIENLVKQNFYEAGVPTRNPEGTPNRPDTLYGYHGTPTVNFREEVLPALEKITPENQNVPKAAVYARYRNEVQQELHGLELTPGFPGRQGYDTARRITQTEFGREIKAQYGDLPLNDFLDRVAQHPVSARQQHMGEIIKAMAEACASREPAIQGKGVRVAQAIAALNPKQSDYADMLDASRSAVCVAVERPGTAAINPKQATSREFSM